MNLFRNQNPPLNQAQNQNQRKTVGTILAKHRAYAIDIAIVTRAGAMDGEDGPHQQVRFPRKKKTTFDIVTEKDTFFEAKHAIGRNLGKSPIIEMAFDFDPFVES